MIDSALAARFLSVDSAKLVLAPRIAVTIFYLADAIGGDAYYGASLAFQLPIYKLPYEHIRAHVFANTGSLVSIFGDTQATMQERISKLAGIPSTSVGLGIAARFAGFRLELNYCAPVIATSSDGLVPGFQFGIGLEFM